MKKAQKSLILMLALLLMQSFEEKKTFQDEYALKAAFLYRFSDYVEWTNNSADYFNIAVLGSSPIVSQLNLIASNKRVKNKSIEIKQYENLNTFPQSNILFVSRDSKIPFETILAKYHDSGTLIVTEQNGYCAKGSDINFVLTGEKLKFEVNQKSINKPGLKISSQLLQHAIIVE
jgi:hypothetical protein